MSEQVAKTSLGIDKKSDESSRDSRMFSTEFERRFDDDITVMKRALMVERRETCEVCKRLNGSLAERYFMVNGDHENVSFKFDSILAAHFVGWLVSFVNDDSAIFIIVDNLPLSFTGRQNSSSTGRCLNADWWPKLMDFHALS